MRTEIFRLDMPFHDELEFYRWDFSADAGSDDGPKIVVISGIQGDQLNGPYISWKLIRFFRENPAALRSGRIRIIPAANPLAINVSTPYWPFDLSNLNALFPGYEQGETTQRIAARLFSALEGHDWCVSLAAAVERLKEIPQIRLYEPSHGAEPHARLFGLPLIWRRSSHHPLDRLLFAAQMGAAGIPTFAIHCGAPRRLNRFYADMTFLAVLRFLAGIGMIDDAAIPESTAAQEPRGRLPFDGLRLSVDDDSVTEVRSPAAGLFVLENDLGRAVREGDLIGRVADPATGEPAVDVVAPHAGLLVTVKLDPLTYEGELLARVAPI
jgi:predicted deacylase